MPAKMDVNGAISRLTISENTTKEYIPRDQRVLMWLSENTDLLKMTTLTDLAKQYFCPEHPMDEQQVYTTLIQLRRSRLLITSDLDSGRAAPKHYALNYWSIEMPLPIFESASEANKQEARAVLSRLETLEATRGTQKTDIPETNPKPEHEPISEPSTSVDIPMFKEGQPFTLTINLNFGR